MTRAAGRPRGRPAPALAARDVPSRLALLGAESPRERAGALRELGRVAPVEAARPALARALELGRTDPDAGVRREAWRFAAGFAREAGVLAALEAGLSDPDESVQQAAAEALPPVPEAARAIRAALGSPNVVVRRTAAGLLRRFEAPSSDLVTAFAQALRDPSRAVRTAAAQSAAVSARGQREVGVALLAALRTETDAATQAFLLGALVETGGVATTDAPILLQLLRRGGEPAVRYRAASALAQLAPHAVEAIPPLVHALERDADPLVRAFAADALGAFGPHARAAIPVLLAIASNRSAGDYRANAVTALGAIDGDASVEVTRVLVASVDDTERWTQRAALIALRDRRRLNERVEAALRAVRLPPEHPNVAVLTETRAALGIRAPNPGTHVDAAEAIQRALGDDDPLARRAAVLEIQRSTSGVDPRWLDGLTRALEDDDLLTRRYAAEALGRAGPRASGSVAALIRSLLAPDGRVDREASLALVAIAPSSPDVHDALARHLLQGRSFRAEKSAYALARLGAVGVPSLVRGVRAEDPNACFAAALALAQVGPPAVEAVPALLELWADPARLTVRRTGPGGTSRSAVRAALRAIAPDDPRVKAALEGAPLIDP